MSKESSLTPWFAAKNDRMKIFLAAIIFLSFFGDLRAQTRPIAILGGNLIDGTGRPALTDWNCTAHLPVMAAAIYRELRGEGPEITPVVEKKVSGRITQIREEGRYLTVVTNSGQTLALRTAGNSDIEGIPDRSHFKVGMKLTATYEEQKEWNEALEVKVEP